jgi:predicted permease
MAALPVTLPHLRRVAINERVLLFTMGLCVFVGVMCSLAPLLLCARTDLQSVLRSGRFAGGPKRPARLFSVLIASEAAFAVLLLVGSGLMVRSLIRLQETDHGIRPDHVLTLRVPIGGPGGKYDTKPRQMAYYHDLVERLRSVSGVRAVAVVNNLPLSNANAAVFVKGPDGQPMLTSTRTISPEYFAAMGIARLAGRSFSDADKTGAPRVAIINEFLARQLFPNRDPLGQLLPSVERGPGSTVVGIVKDSPQMSYDKPPKGEVYLPYQQTIFGVFLSTIVVRTSGDPLSRADALRKQIWTVDPDQPIVKVETMNDIIADSIWRPRFSAWIFSILGGLALLLTCAGVYAMVTYTSALRMHEVGIRLALGASTQQVTSVILRSGVIPLAVGLTAGINAALLLSRFLSSILYEIRGNDLVTYLAAALLLLTIGIFASAGPAWRAASGDPLKALRME